MSYAVGSSLPSVTRAQRVAGAILSGLVIAFLLFDGVIKLVPLPAVTETMAGLGYSADPIRPIRRSPGCLASSPSAAPFSMRSRERRFSAQFC